MKKKYFLFSILFVAVFIVFFSLQTKTTQSVACSLMTASVSPSSGSIAQTVAISWYAQACDHVDINLGGYVASNVQSPYNWTLSGPPEQYTVSAYGYCNNPIDGPYFDGTYLCGQRTVSVSAAIVDYTVSCVADSGVSCTPSTQTVTSGNTTTLNISPVNSGYSVYSVTGCGGSPNGPSDLGFTYTTGPINSNCTVNATSQVKIPVVNGICGSSNGGSFYTAPSTNLCTQVTASAVSGSGPWTWSCYGSGGGSTASCSANKLTYTITTNVDSILMGGGYIYPSSTGGSISPTSPQVNSGANQVFQITENPGYTYSLNASTSCPIISVVDNYNSTYTLTAGPITQNCNLNIGFITSGGGGGTPDLTAGTVTPTSATTGVSTSYSVTVTNIGNASTGASFNNFFQVATAAGGGGTVTDLASTSMATLASSASSVTTKSYTFSSAGTYSMRACADKSSAGNTGTIAESNEGNNCGTWTTVTVTTASVMSGTLTPSASACTIVLGGNSCTVNLSWTTTNPVATSSVTSPYPVANTVVGSGNSGTVNGVIIPYNNGNGRDFYLYNNAQQLAFQNVTANCGSNAWNGTMCTTGGAPLVNGACSSPQAHYTCSAGTSINNVDGASTWTWSCQGSGGGSTASCSENKPVTPKPDLTADNPTPTTAVRNSTTTLSSAIHNIGNASTGASFSNFFQVATGAGGTGTITDLASTTMSTLPFGANALTTQTYPFPLVGTYSIRTCADKTSSAGGGVITESEENNNCSSPWVDVVVSSTGAGTWSAWSDCINGVKTRTCTPINTCSGASSMACSTPKIKEN